MVIIFVCLTLCSSILFGAADNKDMFTSEQREEAKAFIDVCFDKIKTHVSNNIRHLAVEEELTAEEAGIVLADLSQIDYVKLNALDRYGAHVKKMHKVAQEYRESIERPHEKIHGWSGDHEHGWNEEHEQSAYALHAFMQLTDEFKVYQADPSNEKAYALMHKHMLEVAATLVGRVKFSYRCFASGRHARPGQDDSDIDYDVDRVFFLAMYLINEDFKGTD